MLKVTGECKRLHEEELNDPYSTPNIIPVIKSRRMRWAGHVAPRDVHTEFWWRNLKVVGDHLEDLGVDGMIVLK